MQEIAHRAVRCFRVYRGGDLALTIEDRPGALHSRAAPAPGGPPRHPFLHGTAYAATLEDELGRLLAAAESFDDYLDRLIAAGYDIAAGGDGQPLRLEQGRRIVAARAPLGALWPAPGQFTTLRWQPAAGELLFPHATLTAYRPEAAPDLLALLQATADFTALSQAIATRGWRLHPPAAGAG